MTVRLYDVVDQLALADAILARHVRVQDHPTEPLRILNYTELCAVTPGAWNRTTLACRGLIYRTDGSFEVVARGFDKFFNHGQAGAPTVDLQASVIVSNKMDGSLGILYPVSYGGWAVATRGSFASEQAVHATDVLRSRYRDFRPMRDVTTLVEIIYPANRIVLDYAGLDDLVLIGGMPLGGGRVIPPSSMQVFTGWPGLVAQTMAAFTFAEALALEPRPNAEGVVVLDLVRNNMVKIKQEDYVALHKIVTGLNARTVWEHLVAGKPLDELIAPLPDEFHDWVRDTAAGIEQEAEAAYGRIHDDFRQVVLQMPDGWTVELGDRESRKVFAAAVAGHADRWALFALLDGRGISAELLKRARPEPYITPFGRAYSEATA